MSNPLDDPFTFNPPLPMFRGVLRKEEERNMNDPRWAFPVDTRFHIEPGSPVTKPCPSCGAVSMFYCFEASEVSPKHPERRYWRVAPHAERRDEYDVFSDV